MSLKSILAKAAPLIGTAIGGPFGALAGSVAAKALGIDEKPTQTETEAAILKAVATDPEAAGKLQQANYDFQVKMRELGIKEADLQVRIEEIHYKDRANAREMNTKKDDWVPKFLVVAIVVMVCGLGYVALYKPPSDSSKDILLMLVGAGLAELARVYQYHFGSSAGSAEKSRMLTGGK